ncbi:MAG: DUF3800 domain-containing protein [Flavobacteriales bacterium]|nr:MAG: DUF3800 domain-containing protein [Flavobacteriales bacterium]
MEQILNEDNLQDETTEQEEIAQDEISREEKLEREGQELLNRILRGNIENIKDRVAFILNNSTDSRNSDIMLAWEYWKGFEPEILTGNTVSMEQMLQLTKISSLSRIRAKIQNEYKLFLADEAVRHFRGMLDEDMRQEAVEDKPAGTGVYSVYIDETGKTQQYLSVGSLWLLNYGYSHIGKMNTLKDWKNRNNINFEFHFTKMSNSSLETYKAFFAKFMSLFPEVGFKLIVVNNSGFTDINSAITDLTYHLISKGVTHEHSSGRAPLPRVLTVYIDDEEVGSDRLKLENVKERLKNQQTSGLFLEEFRAIASSENFYIQAVDLFTGAVNRKLHFPNGTHAKDELANYILNIVNFNIDDINITNNYIDQSAVFNLSDYNLEDN